MNNKFFWIVSILCLSSINLVLANSLTQQESVQEQLDEQGVSYMWLLESGRVAVVEKEDASKVCQLAKDNPGAKITSVFVYVTNETVKCN